MVRWQRLRWVAVAVELLSVGERIVRSHSGVADPDQRMSYGVNLTLLFLHYDCENNDEPIVESCRTFCSHTPHSSLTLLTSASNCSCFFVQPPRRIRLHIVLTGRNLPLHATTLPLRVPKHHTAQHGQAAERWYQGY